MHPINHYRYLDNTNVDIFEYVNISSIRDISSCTIQNIRTEILNCDTITLKFGLQIDFNYTMTLDSFRVGGNGFNYGTFAYKDLPIQLNNLDISNAIEYEFVIVDKNTPLCFAVYTLGQVKDCTHKCSLTDLQLTTFGCTDSVNLGFTFIEKFASLEGFNLFVNDELYKSFHYELDEYTFSLPLNKCDKVTKIRVEDLGDLTCNIEVEYIEEECCLKECILTHPTITEDCVDEKLSGLWLNFVHESSNDSFFLKINDVFKGKYSYNTLPIWLDSLDQDLPELLFEIRDSIIDSCHLNFQYTVACYMPPRCSIDTFSIDSIICNGSGDYFIKYHTSVTHSSADSFDLFWNNVLFTREKQGSSSYTHGPFPAHTDFVDSIMIRDQKDIACVSNIKIIDGSTCAINCHISDLKILENCQNGKLLDVGIDFIYHGVSDSFYLLINGQPEIKYAYQNLPITIREFNVASDTLSIEIYDSKIDTCRLAQFHQITCIPTFDCIFNNLKIDSFECLSNEELNIKFSFEVQHPKSEMFALYLDDIFVDTLLIADSGYNINVAHPTDRDSIKLRVVDTIDSTCMASICIYNVKKCVFCTLDSFKIEVLPCTSGKYKYKINFNHRHNSDMFRIWINDTLIGSFKYSALPIIFDGFQTSEMINLQIFDSENIECSIMKSFLGSVCTSAGETTLDDKLLVHHDPSFLYINFPSRLKMNYAVIDISGSRILTGSMIDTETINIQNLSSGLYILLLYNEQKKYQYRWMKL